MSYGMRIKNNDLKIIIDENYSNYVLYESGTLTLVFSTSPNTLRGSHSFSSSISVPPIIALKPRSDYHIGLEKYTQSGDNYAGFSLVGSPAGAGNLDIDWMAFVPVSHHESTENYGLKIFNASGDVTFDSGRKYLKIVSIISSNLSSGGSSATGYKNENLTHATGTHYFTSAPFGLIADIESFGVSPTRTGYSFRVAGFKYINSTTVNFAETAFVGYSVMDDIRNKLPFGFWPSPWSILVVEDVT
jgi:hypothetical protein